MELRTMSIERSVLEKVVRRIGGLGCVQFRDMNGVRDDDGEERAVSQRSFVTQIRTCESVERSLRYFDDLLETFPECVEQVGSNASSPVTPDPPLGVEDFRGALYTNLPNALETLARRLASDEASLKDQCEKLERYKTEFKTAAERIYAVRWAQQNSDQRNLDIAADELQREEHSLLDVQGGTKLYHIGGGGTLGQLIGIIGADRVGVFNRLVHRVTKGNVLVSWRAIEDEEGIDGDKCIFRILYTSYEMQTRILKLTATNYANVHMGKILLSADGRTDPRTSSMQRLPDNQTEFDRLLSDLSREVEDRTRMIQSTENLVFDKLRTISRVHTERRHYVLKEKAVYHTLNMMLVDQGQFAKATVWIPSREVHRVAEVLSQHPLCGLNTGDLKESDTSEPPPTYFDTNDFTGTFQGIVDSYGIPRYHEVNPAIFTIVTFPWFFGIMYGDVGHGMVITLAASLMIFFQNRLKRTQLNEMVDMIFSARWLLLLMGIFAVYMGFLYNDCFGMMLQYSDSRYVFPEDWVNGKKYENLTCYDGTVVPVVCNTECHMKDLKLVTVTSGLGASLTRCTCPNQVNLSSSVNSCPNFVNYNSTSANLMQPSSGPTWFGFDSAWHESDNKLTYFNSYKMKNAVLCGVLQMSLGLILSLYNHRYFGDVRHIYFGFIPECVFLFCTFGYMCIMIIAKWLTPWPNTNLAPNTLETMTKFFLSPGGYNLFDAEKCAAENDCSGYDYLYTGQKGVQVMMLVFAVMAVPVMLFPIPILKGKEKKARIAAGDPEAAMIDMQEVWIKQVIHVIEYVLGCVSNTASYLRLWALSLAHAELSEVFWKFAIMKPLASASGGSGGVIMWFGFGAWLSATLGVLILMEALSAFLHSLRLHWVEFQTKFYVGDGVRFTPLDFDEIIEEADRGRA
eukprot:TRINITY_DN19923_c0_g1_i1.p1 TRINITY_DN19923_c0_g1~~TRINITY_DN19923_c0_g1_i1.p1  ORF type:complete len:955 (+),score=151.90 TRINITY_DN19923_c0_g1_i1:143-2866(+)